MDGGVPLMITPCTPITTGEAAVPPKSFDKRMMPSEELVAALNDKSVTG
jgi:hypothetical protein